MIISGNLGCLSLLLGFFLLLFLFKFWVIAFLLLLVGIFVFKGINKVINIKSTFAKKEEYINKPGKVYKVCSFCDTKAERSSSFCNNCKRPFEGIN